MKILILTFLSFIILNFSCKKNDEESAFLTFKNKRMLMNGDWTVKKAYGKGMDLTDSLNYDMPNLALKIRGYMDYYDNNYYEFFVNNSFFSGKFKIKNSNNQVFSFRPIYYYSAKELRMPTLNRKQLDSLNNSDTITYQPYFEIYTIKSITSKEIKMTNFTNHYSEIILQKK